MLKKHPLNNQVLNLKKRLSAINAVGERTLADEISYLFLVEHIFWCLLQLIHNLPGTYTLCSTPVSFR